MKLRIINTAKTEILICLATRNTNDKYIILPNEEKIFEYADEQINLSLFHKANSQLRRFSGAKLAVNADYVLNNFDNSEQTVRTCNSQTFTRMYRYTLDLLYIQTNMNVCYERYYVADEDAIRKVVLNSAKKENRFNKVFDYFQAMLHIGGFWVILLICFFIKDWTLLFLYAVVYIAVLIIVKLINRNDHKNEHEETIKIFEESCTGEYLCRAVYEQKMKG